MSSLVKYITVLAAIAAAGCCEAFGQLYPERKHIRRGNNDYEKLDYGAAEGDYRTAISKEPASFEASFNLGDALYKQERFEEAENTFSGVLESVPMGEQQAARTLYNLGNTQFAQQKLKEAAESYMKSLTLNPDDLEAKYNLAYVQKLMEDQQGGGGGDGGNDQDQDGENDQQGQQGEDDPQDGDQEQNEEQDDPQDGQQDRQEKPEAQEQQREGAISKEDAEKILEALRQEEDKTRDKVNEKQAVQTTRSGRNW